jgi:glycosyltransferase involved in cell wall biosynthesis
MAKKKILLLSDDMRIPSGVGTMSNALIKNTIHKYDWAQIAGAVKHPEQGQKFDVGASIGEQVGVKDAYCKLYPVNGYGNEQILREVLAIEKPDAIMHFTDPRFWDWLYNMEHELRQTTPIMYLNIWDDLPFPHWNESAYESCDLLMAISKQTYNINKHVCQRKPRVEEKDLFYVQHGINEKVFYPIKYNADTTSDEHTEFAKFKNAVTNGRDYNFVALFNSRNIHRKRVSDLVLAYAKMCEGLAKEQSDKCLLVLHTDPVDQHGTDLPALVRALCPYPVAFSDKKLEERQLNWLYNIADVVCNPSSAEGFGLSHMEAMMSGTPTIATVIGGLQDQMGFKVDGEEFNVKHLTADIPSNSTGKISKEHGEWVYPLWPQLNLQGSPLTPYIYDSRPSVDSITKGLEYWYSKPNLDRERAGDAGREWAIENGFTHAGMAEAAIKAIEVCFETFTPRDKFKIINTSQVVVKQERGILL